MIIELWTKFLGLPRGFHIVAGIGLMIIAAFTLHKCAVRDAVNDDRKAAQGEVARKQLGAERSANEFDAARQGEIRDNDAATRKAINDAVAKDPAIKPAGSASRAAADSLRNRSAGDRSATSK